MYTNNFSITGLAPLKIPFRFKKYKSEIDRKLKSIKVPNRIARLFRPLKDSKYWKSKKFENWLLYYSLFVLDNIPGFE